MDQETIDKLVTVCGDKDLFREEFQDGEFYCVFKAKDYGAELVVKCEHLNMDKEIHAYGKVYYGCENKRK